ncbi:MAG TPA: hypothetical protein ENN08_06700 [Bacteroidales bacterium]|nr:hypothetical protein [Bacteroidales bacterium]
MLNKTILRNDIKKLMQDMMKRENSSIDEFATRLANAVDSYVKGASVVATPAQVAAAALSNAGGPVVAAGNLNSTLN